MTFQLAMGLAAIAGQRCWLMASNTLAVLFLQGHAARCARAASAGETGSSGFLQSTHRAWHPPLLQKFLEGRETTGYQGVFLGGPSCSAAPSY